MLQECTRWQLLLGWAALVAGCLHDFTREARDLSGSDGRPDVAADLPGSDIRLDSRASVDHPAPDAGCSPPCVQTIATIAWPLAVAVDSAGKVYVLAASSQQVHQIKNGQATWFAGGLSYGDEEGPVQLARFRDPKGLAVVGGKVYVADTGNHRIRLIENGQVSTLAGSGSNGFLDGPAGSAQFRWPEGVAALAGKVYVADTGNHRIRLIENGQVSTLAGSESLGFSDGPALSASFRYPTSLALDPTGKVVYVADSQNNRVRAVEKQVVTTVAGNDVGGFRDGSVDSAEFYWPYGVATFRTELYVADYYNNRIRVICANKVRTLAGTGSSGFQDGPLHLAEFNTPTSVAVDSACNVYVADHYNNRIRLIRR